MGKKILIAGLVAGTVMFIWSSIAHVVLPTGELGASTTANEEALLAAMKSNLSEPGMYYIPGDEVMKASKQGREQYKTAMQAFEKKYGNGPHALLIYHPTGATEMEPKKLVFEFLSDLAAGLIVAFVLAMSAVRVRGFGARVAFIMLIGLLPWIVVDFSYWNWYGFPSSYQVAELIDQVGSFFFGGVALAFFFRQE